MPPAPAPTVLTQELIEKVLAISRGERTCLDSPPPKQGFRATAAQIIAARELIDKPTDADLPPLTGIAKQIFEAAEKARNLGK